MAFKLCDYAPLSGMTAHHTSPVSKLGTQGVRAVALEVLDDLVWLQEATYTREPWIRLVGGGAPGADAD